jgi:hypothetical protein
VSSFSGPYDDKLLDELRVAASAVTGAPKLNDAENTRLLAQATRVLLHFGNIVAILKRLPKNERMA